MKDISIKYVEELTDCVFKQAEQGRIKLENDTISPWVFYVKFYSKDMEMNNDVPTVIIRNKKRFLENIKTYLAEARTFYESDKEYFELTERSFDEKLVMDLFVNASNYDLHNIEDYIIDRTRMFKARISEGTVCLGQYENCTIYARTMKCKSNLEAPFQFHIWLKQNDERFVLPSISYGVDNHQANIYAIQGMRTKQENKLAKKMDRHFRKVNKGIDSEDEILSKVSPNALVSLAIFLAYKNELGINSVSAVNFMPIRYNANLVAGTIKNEQAEEQFLEKHDLNQFNITNRFMYTLIRYAHQFGLDYDYDEIKERLNLSLTPTRTCDSDNILIDVDKEIRETVNKAKQEMIHAC